MISDTMSQTYLDRTHRMKITKLPISFIMIYITFMGCSWNKCIKNFGFFRPIEYSFLEPVIKMVWLFDINMQFPGRTVANVWRPRENLNVEHQADNTAGVFRWLSPYSDWSLVTSNPVYHSWYRHTTPNQVCTSFASFGLLSAVLVGSYDY